MRPRLRKISLSTHITTSVGLLGAIAAFSCLSVSGLFAHEEPSIRAAYHSMDLIARWIISPLALAALLSGTIASLGTAWGLFRYYWIVAKLLITTLATLVLLAKLNLIADAAHLVEEQVLRRDDLRPIGIELTVHALAGLCLLNIPAVLSVYKPLGLTPYGQRAQRETRTLPPPSHRSPAPARPSSSTTAKVRNARGTIVIELRRVQLLSFATVVVVAHLVALHLMGVTHNH